MIATTIHLRCSTSLVFCLLSCATLCSAQDLLGSPRPVVTLSDGARFITATISNSANHAAILLNTGREGYLLVCELGGPLPVCSERIRLTQMSEIGGGPSSDLALTNDLLLLGLPSAVAGVGHVPGLDLIERGRAPWARGVAVEAAGVVRLWHLGSQGWNQVSILEASRPRRYDRFGSSVAAESNWVAVGCPGGGLGGYVNLFRMSQGRAVYSQTLHGEPGDAFGATVAISKGWLAAGAPGRSKGRGAVAFYSLEGNRWIRRTVLNGDGVKAERFAWRFALSNNILVVTGSVPSGAGSDTGPLPGSVNVYRLISGVWRRDGKLSSAQADVLAYNRWLANDGERIGVSDGKTILSFRLSGTVWKEVGSRQLNTGEEIIGAISLTGWIPIRIGGSSKMESRLVLLPLP
jgi:hypothetical protein